MGFIKALQDHDFTVVVITPIDDFINHIYKADVEYEPLYTLTRKSKNPLKDFRLYQEFHRIYRKIKPDVVIQYTIKPNIYGGLAAHRLGIKTISVIPGLGHAFVHKGILQNITTYLYKKSLRHSSKVIFENNDDRLFFLKKGIIKQEQSETFKGCGVDISYFKPIPKKTQTDGKVFLFMGRLILEKGIREFVEAANRIAMNDSTAQFWIIGHIDEENPSAVPKADFLKWIAHPQIKYLGFKDDVRQIISDADCVVLPTYYPEGIPRVLQEGMAMEKPIITTDTNGCREAVEAGKNGWLVKPSSADDLYNKMTTVTKLSSDQLLEMGKYGREKAIKEFDERISIERYIDIVKTILSASRTK